MSGDYKRTWLESGLGALLATLFRVPSDPPTLPARDGERIVTTHPAPGYLSYSLLGLWVCSAVVLVGLVVVSLILMMDEPELGLLTLAAGGILLALLTAILYLMTYMVYCTTWYVLSNRSVRIRKGILNIVETTITFENVQNVSVSQGPLQRLYGIADVQIDTAGGGAAAGQQAGENPFQSMHKGIIQGIDNAEELRNVIVHRMKKSGSAGLGDDRNARRRGAGSGFGPEHIAALRAIRDTLRQMAR